MNIKENIIKLKNTIPSNVRLVAVSKTKPVSDITEAYQAGQRSFGENKALELNQKYQLLPKDIDWHFIGHLQTNKVKYIAPFVNLIHSIDSLKLLQEINKEAQKNNRTIDCLLQFYIASEESKFGLDYKEASELLDKTLEKLKNVRIIGVMGMATFTDNKTLIKKEFKLLKEYYHKVSQAFFNNVNYFKEISMGMTDDYQIAIEEGSTIVRIGSAIFGSRK